jgi:hypothetical protein
VFDLIASAEQLGKMVCLFDNAEVAPRYHHKKTNQKNHRLADGPKVDEASFCQIG